MDGHCRTIDSPGVCWNNLTQLYHLSISRVLSCAVLPHHLNGRHFCRNIIWMAIEFNVCNSVKQCFQFIPSTTMKRTCCCKGAPDSCKWKGGVNMIRTRRWEFIIDFWQNIIFLELDTMILFISSWWRLPGKFPILSQYELSFSLPLAPCFILIFFLPATNEDRQTGTGESKGNATFPNTFVSLDDEKIWQNPSPFPQTYPPTIEQHNNNDTKRNIGTRNKVPNPLPCI